MRVREFLKSADQGLFDVLLNTVKPSNRLAGIEVPDISKWRFCDVMEMGGGTPMEVVKKVLSFHGSVTEAEILAAPAKDFVALIKHIRNEVDRVSKMMETLQSEPDNDLAEAGIGQLDRFGVLTIYYGISKDPREWDEISEVSFAKMYNKLLMDKINGDVQKKYNQILSERQKRKK